MGAKVIIILAALLLVAGGVYFYLDTEVLTPEQELLRAAENMANLDSFTMETELQAEGEDAGEELSLLLSAVTDIDRREEGSYRSVINGEVFAEGVTVDFGGEVTYVGDNLYGRVDVFPTVLLPGIPDEIRDLVGVDILLMENVSQDLEEEMETFDEDLAEAFEEEGLDPMTMQEIAEHMEDIATKALEDEVIKVSETEDDEVRGVPATKYTIEIDYEKLPDFMIEIAEDYEDTFPGIDVEEVREEMERAKEEMEEMEEMETEFYVWADGEHILRVQFLFEMEEEDVSLEFNTFFGNFNEEFEITAPEEYMELEEVSEMMMGLFSPFGPTPMPDIQGQEDMEWPEGFEGMEDFEEELQF